MEEYIADSCFNKIAARYDIEDFVNIDFNWDF
ncbi:hypothetical protein FNP_1417 [Fusobacterium polymorphum ATCC 10953]|uniref:Uncharacterized protein n=1 Tax=Fusobacterium polymorphum ATCC 10953 TaxID=393480 RepID=A5TWC4_FUSNP|nr:hypothetical protein FNP_1417 [Fusobacterium polymorphum ATCC 10953]